VKIQTEVIPNIIKTDVDTNISNWTTTTIVLWP